LKTLIRDFYRNEGFWVVGSSILGKVLGFLTTIIIARLFSLDDFGILTVALNFISFFLPAIGVSSSHGLLHFYPKETEPERKKNILEYSNWTGFLLQIALTVFIIILSLVFYRNEVLVLQLSLFMMIRLFGLFLMGQKKAELRASFQNRKFARLENIFNFSLLILGILGAYFFGIWGYVIGISIAPFTMFLFHKITIKNVKISALPPRKYWNYSLASLLTLLVFMWAVVIDVFLVARYFTDREVAVYKLSIIIPYHLIFIGQVYTLVMYPKLCKESNNKRYLREFVKNYMYIFAPIVFLLTLFSYIYAGEILFLVFEKDLNPTIFRIMLIQMAMSILLRIPFGNLLSAIGWIKQSFWIGVFVFVSILGSAFLLLPTGKIETMAYISLFSNLTGGIISACIFFVYLKRQKNNLKY